MPLNIGLIGCGGITAGHIAGWQTVSDRARLVAVADVVTENAQNRAAMIGGGVDIHTDFADLLADERIDAVDICLPHHLHRDAIVAAAQAGKHIMTEKPLCLDMEEAMDIAEAVRQNGVMLMAAHNQLFFPAMQQAKFMLLQGDLGEVYEIHSLDCGARRGGLSHNKANWHGRDTNVTMADTWRNDPEKMGGGELIDTGYHPTYRLLFLAGERPVEVTAMLGRYRLPLAREDTAHVLVRFESGVIGKIDTSWAMRSPGARRALFYVMGEKGQLWGEMDRLYYQPVGFETPATIDFPDWTGRRTMAAEIAHFVDAIEDGFEPLHSVAEAIDTLRLILAAYRSAETKQVVAL